MSYILFICVVTPLCSLLAVSDKKMRNGVIFLLVGMFSCLFVSEVNGLLNRQLGTDMFYLTTSVTPITEEIVKTVPVLIYAFAYSDKLEELVPNAFFIGIGFAVLENLVILTQNIGSVTLIWAVIRGFSSGLMHGICTGMVGICISFVRKKHKLLLCGTIAALDLAISYHSIFNSLVQGPKSIQNYLGFAMPITTYIPIVIFIIKRNRTKTE